MKRLALLVLSILIAFPASRAFADVLDVRGPSPDYSEIAAAVTAAQDGDVLRIWPGTYQPFWIDDKSLTLVAADDSAPVMVDGTYRIKNLAADRSVEISGVSATGTDGRALVVSDCRGSVRIREGNFVGAWVTSGWEPWRPPSGILVTYSDDVELTSCTALGGALYWSPGHGAEGGTGLEVESSRVSLYSSTFEGRDGTDGYDEGSDGGFGYHGVLAWDGGRVYLSDCTLSGGNGGDSGPEDIWFGCGLGGKGGWGYAGTGSPAPEAWFLDSVFQAGLGGESCGHSGWDGYDGSDHSPGTELPGDARTLRASRLIDDQSALELIFRGTPGDLVSVRFARTPDYAFDVVRGPLLLHSPAPPQLRPWRILGTIDATGVLHTAIDVKDLPVLGHRTLHVQGNLISSENYYTSSSWTVLLDAVW